MYKKSILLTSIALIFSACGGSSDFLTENSNLSSNSSSQATKYSGKYINPDNINLKADIDNGKIVDYEPNGDRESNYLAVINYLRSLPIKCNDEQGFTGPSPKIEWNELLKNSSLEHSIDMGKQDYFAHDGSGKDSDITAKENGLNRGSHFYERVKYAGYDYTATGENIAMYATRPNTPPEDSWINAMEGLIKSRHGHCSNIMNSGFKEVGMAEYRTTTKDAEGYYKAYWTQDFGTR